MSTIEGAEQMVSFLQQLSVENCCILAVTVLVFYDHFLTLSQEVKYVWKSRLSTASIIFYLNRYIILALSITDAVGFFPFRGVASCKALNIVYSTLEVLWYAVWAAFSCLRIYAISGRSWRVSGLALLLGLVPCGMTLYSTIKTKYSTSSTTSVLSSGICLATSMMATHIDDRVVITTRVCLIASDIIVVVATWYYTSKIELTARAPSSVATLLLRDGTLYFVLLLSMNVIQISLFVTKVFQCTADFIIRITAVLVSRYILNLRQFSTSHNGAVTYESSSASRSTRAQSSYSAHAKFTSSSSSSTAFLNSKRHYRPESSESADAEWGWKDISSTGYVTETTLENIEEIKEEMELSHIASVPVDEERPVGADKVEAVVT